MRYQQPRPSIQGVPQVQNPSAARRHNSVSSQYCDDSRTWKIFRGPFVWVRPRAPAFERFQRLPFVSEQRAGNRFDRPPTLDDQPLGSVFELSQKGTDIVSYEVPLRKLRDERSPFAPIATIDDLVR